MTAKPVEGWACPITPRQSHGARQTGQSHSHNQSSSLATHLLIGRAAMVALLSCSRPRRMQYSRNFRACKPPHLFRWCLLDDGPQISTSGAETTTWSFAKRSVAGVSDQNVGSTASMTNRARRTAKASIRRCRDHGRVRDGDESTRCQNPQARCLISVLNPCTTGRGTHSSPTGNS